MSKHFEYSRVYNPTKYKIIDVKQAFDEKVSDVEIENPT